MTGLPALPGAAAHHMESKKALTKGVALRLERRFEPGAAPEETRRPRVLSSLKAVFDPARDDSPACANA